MLDQEYQKLEALKHTLFQVQNQVLQKEHEIFLLINEDFQLCSGITCYLQTALRKVPDLFQLVKTHFRHHPKNSTSNFWDCPWSTKTPTSDEATAPLPTPSISESDAGAHPHQIEDNTASTTSLHGNTTPSPLPTRDPQPSIHHGTNDHPSSTESQPIHGSSSDKFDSKPETPSSHSPTSHRPFHMPHPAPRHKHFKLILAVAGFTTSILIIAVLFKALRIYLSNPRIRAECAARNEERRTRREYRRAACQHRLRQFISNFYRRSQVHDEESDDDEEKRTMLRQNDSQSQAESHIVGTNISSLHRAHEVVRQLIKAEEGRVNNQALPYTQAQNETEATSSRSVRSLQTVTTLPPYSAAPPRYSQELNSEMEIINGFRLALSPREATGIASSASSFILNDDDICTESSVVDCRSRMSMDTESVSVAHSVRAVSRDRKSLELAGDRFRERFS